MSLEQEIRRIAHHEGFKGITAFYCYYMSFGYSTYDIKVHMASVYNIHYSLSCYYSTLNPYRWKAKRQYHRTFVSFVYKREGSGFSDTKAYRRWIRISKSLGWSHPKDAVNDLKEEGLTNKQIAKYFKVSESTLKKRIKKWSL